MSPLRMSLILALLVPAVGCASSRLDLVPVPTPDGTVAVSEDGVAKLRVQVQNQGEMPAEASPVAVKFYLRNVVLTTAVQDGGPLQAGESSSVLEFEIPEDCVEGGCAFQVCVDPEKAMEGEKRSNNNARGHCEGTMVSTESPAPRESQPQVQ